MNSLKEKKNIDTIFKILRDNKINSEESLSKLKPNDNGLLYAGDFPWIAEIATIINDFYDDADQYITDVTGKVFLVDQMKAANCNDLLKYSCIFPDRMIISAGNFFYLNTPAQAFIDIELLKKLFWSKTLLDSGIVHISPFARYTDMKPGKGDFNNALRESLSLSEWNKKKIAALDKCGIGNSDSQVKDRECLFLAIPWLKNARIEDYNEIIQKNKMEFENYNLHITKLFEQHDDVEKVLKELKYDLQETNINIRIALENKQADLRRKGIVTALTFSLSLIPLFVPIPLDVDPQLITSVIGVGGVSPLIPDIISIKDVGKEDAFWVLWKWMKTAKGK